uniref:Uncharacterized protein n=1 Tax=Caenorhabditis japonica TaxID=281687 RepID=A0A8R1HV69_CAEJA
MSSKLVILAYATALIKYEPKLDCWDQNLADRIVILLNQHEEGHQETVLTRSSTINNEVRTTLVIEPMFTEEYVHNLPNEMIPIN